jgi:hypothetical protein
LLEFKYISQDTFTASQLDVTWFDDKLHLNSKNSLFKYPNIFDQEYSHADIVTVSFLLLDF